MRKILKGYNGLITPQMFFNPNGNSATQLGLQQSTSFPNFNISFQQGSSLMQNLQKDWRQSINEKLWNDATKNTFLEGQSFNPILDQQNENIDNLTGTNINYGDQFVDVGIKIAGQLGGAAGQAVDNTAGTIKKSISNLRALKAAQKNGVEGLGKAKTGNAMAIAGAASDLIGSFMPEKTEYDGQKGDITQTLDSTYDAVSNAAMSFGPVGMIVGGAMKGANLLGKGFNALGGGTDGMTTQDAILGSSFFSWNIGAINGFGGKRADTITKDDEAFANVGSSYTGSNWAVDSALQKSGKKYGLFSGSARNQANEDIYEARRQQSIISNISENASNRFAIANAMSAINGNRRALQLNGGYDQSAVRVGKHGIDLKTLSKAKEFTSKYNSKGVLASLEPESYNILQALEPEYIEEFKNGGSSLLVGIEPEELNLLVALEPVQEFKEGGPVETKKYSKPTYEEWVKTVPKSRLSDFYDLETAYNTLPFYELESWRTATNKELQRGEKHLPSCVEIENGIIMFLKKGQEDSNKPDYNPEVHFELDQWFDPNEHGWYDYGRQHYDLVYKDGRYWYVPKEMTEEFSYNKESRTLDELIQYAKEQNPRFIQRMSEPVRDIEFTDEEGNLARGTHYLAAEYDNGNWYVFPQIFEDESGNLIYEPDVWKALDINKAKGNVLKFNTKEEALLFSESPDPEHGYKKGWPEFFKQYYKEGGKFNVIPEGALHARLHHMENADNITKKGIPVVSEKENGEIEQQAEIEREEIIFRLEVTKKLEELAKDGSDKAAIEAGKLLVEEILNNTIDNTNKFL